MLFFWKNKVELAEILGKDVTEELQRTDLVCREDANYYDYFEWQSS